MDEKEKNEIIKEIHNLKSDLIVLINGRLDNFKTEILDLIEKKLEPIHKNMNDLYCWLQEHDKKLSEHDLKIKGLQDKESQKSFSTMKKIAVIYLIANILITFAVPVIFHFLGK